VHDWPNSYDSERSTLLCVARVLRESGRRGLSPFEVARATQLTFSEARRTLHGFPELFQRRLGTGRYLVRTPFRRSEDALAQHVDGQIRQARSIRWGMACIIASSLLVPFLALFSGN